MADYSDPRDYDLPAARSRPYTVGDRYMDHAGGGSSSAKAPAEKERKTPMKGSHGGTLYTKRPTQTEAMQWTGANWNTLEDFANFLVRKGQGANAFVYVNPHNTWVEFKQGDWIVYDSKGFLYPIEESEFAANYEQANQVVTSVLNHPPGVR